MATLGFTLQVLKFSWQVLKSARFFLKPNLKFFFVFLLQSDVLPSISHGYLLFPNNPEAPKDTTGYLRFIPTCKETATCQGIIPS